MPPLRPTIYVAVAGLTAEHRAKLAAGTEAFLVYAADVVDRDRENACRAAEVVFGNVPPAWLRGTTSARWVQLDSAGVDAYVGTAAVAGPTLRLTHLRGFYDRAVSEAVLGGVLALHRRLPQLLAAQARCEWIKPEVEPSITRLHGSRVVILGAGGIGRRLAAILASFECNVTLCGRTPSAGRIVLADLDQLLPDVDLLINTLPQTPETNGVISRARLMKLKPHAMVVNAGRGSALDEDALLERIAAGHLAGAVLDVTSREPLPPDSALWQAANVVLTQHTGGRFPGETDAKIAVFLQNFVRYRSGQTLLHEVGTGRGY